MLAVTVHPHELEARFKPLRPASHKRLVLAAVFGPFTWALAFALVSVLVSSARAIVIGLLITVASLVMGAGVLVVLRRGRDSEERRYVGPA
jgi:hypothetical protein